jgi:hypothetical protein
MRFAKYLPAPGPPVPGLRQAGADNNDLLTTNFVNCQFLAVSVQQATANEREWMRITGETKIPGESGCDH